MLKTCISRSALFAAALILSAPLYAQQDKPGEARAAPSKPATSEEKAAAKAQRKTTGKEVSKEGEGRLEDPAVPATKSKKYTKDEKAAAKAKRKETGKAVSKSGEGRVEEMGPTDKK